MIDPKHNGKKIICEDPGRQSDKSKTVYKVIYKVTNHFLQYQAFSVKCHYMLSALSDMSSNIKLKCFKL